jgi:DNA polymerase alpha-associated DNA helicase A
MNQIMGKLQRMKTDEYSSFVRVLFGLTTPSPVSEDLKGEVVDWVDPGLNDSQKEAIKFALASREVALIHGPPGVSI